MAVAGKFDAAVLGAGVMGGACAIRLLEAGLKVAVLDRGRVARGASGANAGTLTENMELPEMILHGQRGQALWQNSVGWLGDQITVVPRLGMALAFTSAEVKLLEVKTELRRKAGAHVRVISGAEARRLEPSLNSDVSAVALSERDGTIVSYEFGRLLKRRIDTLGGNLVEDCRVLSVSGGTGDFEVRTALGNLRAASIVLAGGSRLTEMFAWFGLQIPIVIRINQLTAIERMPSFLNAVLTVADERLSLKQMPNGTTIIGGGWQGRRIGEEERAELIPENLVGNLRLAVHCVPVLRAGRIIRIWHGFEAETADGLALLGPVSSVPGLWVAGACPSGFTKGPFLGRLLADAMLGRSLEASLFPPDRFLVGS